jgi:hypothetical protein
MIEFIRGAWTAAAGAVLDDGKDVDLRAVEQVGSEEVRRQDPRHLGPEDAAQAQTTYTDDAPSSTHCVLAPAAT